MPWTDSCRYAQLHGAKVVTGGRRGSNKGYFYEPTLLRDVPDTARIMSEEPFGPIAPVTPFSSFDEVIERANALPYGLASFVFTRDMAWLRRANWRSTPAWSGSIRFNVSLHEVEEMTVERGVAVSYETIRR